MMTSPPNLKIGDTIAIVASAGKIAAEKVESARKVLESWDLKVVLGSNLFKDHHQFSATDAERLEDLQKALYDPSVKAILFARGGYGVIRILDRIDFSVFRDNPKWLIGFSDITIFHSHIFQIYSIEAIHASMAAGLTDPVSAESLRKTLFGENIEYEIVGHPLNRRGTAEGILEGGNLSILCSLIGSVSEVSTREKILFIEDVGEHLYRLDRMMWQMKRAQNLFRIKGLIVGGMTEMKDGETPFGKSAYEIIADSVRNYNYPVCFGFPAGHQPDNRAMIIGRMTKLIVDEIVTFKQTRK
jgi:muramoyltetrapeptide carboxypeptidase